LTFNPSRRFTVEHMSGLRISQLAKASGVPASTLRFYEAAGLLPAERTPTGYRTYSQDAVERLGFISKAKHLGLSLDAIGELLQVRDSGTCAQVKASLQPRVTTRLAETEADSVELAAFAEVLRGTLAHLDALPDRAEPCDPTCTLPTPTTSATPIACTLSPNQAGERVAQWRNATATAVRNPIKDGLRLTLPVEHAVTLTALAAAEQQCCPFFDFRLHLDGERVHLEVRVPPHATALLHNLLTAAEVDR
jgi:MerR family copper efflux transcriptional regulator